MFDIFGALFLFAVFLGFYVLIKDWKQTTAPLKKQTLKYILLGLTATVILNLGNFPALYGYEIYPAGNFTFIPILLIGYGLLRRYFNSVSIFFRQILHYTLLLAVIGTVSFLISPSLWTMAGLALATGLFFRTINRWIEIMLNLVFQTDTQDWPKLLQQANNRLSISINVESIRQALIPYFLKHLSCQKCWLFFEQDHALYFEGDSFVYAKHNDPAELDYQIQDHVRFSAEHPVVQMLYELQDQVLAEHLDEWMRSRSLRLSPEDLFTRAVLLQPVFFHGALVGILVLEEKLNEQLYSFEELRFIRHISSSLGPIIENVKLVSTLEQRIQDRTRDLQKAHREISHLNEVTQAVNSSLLLEDVLKSFMGVMLDIFSFNQLGVVFLQPDENLHFVSYSIGFTEEQLKALSDFRIPIKTSFSVYASTVLHNEPSYFPQIDESLQKLLADDDRILFEISPIKSLVLYPVEVRGHVIGLLHFGNTKTYYDLQEAEIEKIQRYVSQIASAINNAKLFEELKTTRIQLAESEKVAAMTKTFEKFVPKPFLLRIAREGLENIELGKGQSDNITILFSDIRSFTALSESMTAQELMNFLNSYLQRMSIPIHEFGGFIDKFIGDAIMALFDFPDRNDSEEAESAVKAAIAMQNALKLYNQHRSSHGYRSITNGIGIHSGQVVIGTVGSESRMDSTVIGDSVNLASRIEGLTKFYGADILISSQTLDLIRDKSWLKLRELDKVKVQGKSKSVGIYEVLNHYSTEIQELKRASGQMILKGLVHRNLQDWNTVRQCFEQALKLYPEDKAVHFLLEQTRQMQTIRLPEDWDGSLILEQK
ncbi:MAG: hypothetical protein HQM12_22280 [SAR324 cluster bacterium]|nr:hypothetical protein [SAR324 cluster bacterium]